MQRSRKIARKVIAHPSCSTCRAQLNLTAISGGCHADAYAAASQRACHGPQICNPDDAKTQAWLGAGTWCVQARLLDACERWVSRPEFGPPKGADLSTCRRASDADWFKSLLAVPAVA